MTILCHNIAIRCSFLDFNCIQYLKSHNIWIFGPDIGTPRLRCIFNGYPLFYQIPKIIPSNSLIYANCYFISYLLIVGDSWKGGRLIHDRYMSVIIYLAVTHRLNHQRGVTRYHYISSMWYHQSFRYCDFIWTNDIYIVDNIRNKHDT